MAVSAITQLLSTRSSAVLLQLQTRLDRLIVGWIFIAGLACTVRIAFSPLKEPMNFEIALPYVLLVCTPVASIIFAIRWFADGDYQQQPQFRLAVTGRWRTVERSEARRHTFYGAGGIMVSLLVGMLLNVPIRALEYLGAMPAVSGTLPPWLSVLHAVMTFDVVLMTSLYSVAFVAALRHVPLFPRLLVAIWGLDIAMQLITAQLVAGTEGLPPAVAAALQSLLDGNMKKALISIALWLPYLLLSKRVNVTFRSRVAA